MYLLQILGNTL